MRYDRQHRRPRGGMSFNATPMVDVIFLLTIFFMLVTRFSSAEQVRMELPAPDESQAKVPRTPQRVTINCRVGDAEDPAASPVRYSIGPNRPEPLWAIGERLQGMHRVSPELAVIVRADRRLPYSAVRPVMDMIAEQGIKMLNVVAHVSEGE